MVPKVLTLASLVLLSLSAFGQSPSRDALQGASPKNPIALGPAPNFSLPSLRDLRLLTRTDFAGKVVYVTIWRTDCPQCQAEADYLVELRKKYTEKGFEILGVADENFDPKSQPVERVLAYAKEKKFEHPLVLNDGGEFHASYYSKIKGTPSAFLIRRNGELEFLGQFATRPDYRADLEKEIERCLAEPAPPSAPPTIEVESLPEFTLLSLRGGAIRNTDLRGKPSLIAVLSPTLTARHGPTLSMLDAKYAPFGLRVLGVTFGAFRDVVADVETKKYTYEVAVPDPDAQDALLGSNARIPKFLFVTPDGRVLKTISTVYGRERGIEFSVFDRYASMLTGRDASLPKLIEASAPRGFRHAELGFSLDPGLLRSTEAADARARFVGAASQELRIVLETGAGKGREDVEKLAAKLGEGVESRQLDGATWEKVRGAAAYLVKESAGSPLGRLRIERLLVPCALGIYVVTARALEPDFEADGGALRKALLSFESGVPAGN
ncbi:MAG: redoxin domain-containing protein [Planctomycetes bacterium]|nr:redoxin domain-containing protein [Planctomycetota bacterium]